MNSRVHKSSELLREKCEVCTGHANHQQGKHLLLQNLTLGESGFSEQMWFTTDIKEHGGAVTRRTGTGSDGQTAVEWAPPTAGMEPMKPQRQSRILCLSNP